jgi:hypothetical protein
MKKFTLKDFILYNGPCFSCGNRINIKMVYVDSDNDGAFQNVKIHSSSMPLVFDKTMLDITLNVKYSFTLNLKMFIKNNKYTASDMDKFITYLGMKDLHLISECQKCKNIVISNKLEFNSNGNIKAITILREMLSVEDTEKIYTLSSEFSNNTTEINIYNFKTHTDPYILETPLLPLYRFKNKENLIKKLKTYILFS